MSVKNDDIRDYLWSASVTADSYNQASSSYQEAILEQYKIYVEMADRVSSRRGVANNFFLTLNTTLLVLIGGLARSSDHFQVWIFVGPLCGLLAECFAWYLTLLSYRQLNGAKYLVIGALEERLPASPWWKAEWKALAEGRDKKIYRPVTQLERWLPGAFAFAYLFLFIVLATR
jgi:hypothetical protein